MTLLSFFTRRQDGRAIPFDTITYQTELEARLSARKDERMVRTGPAKAGHSARWAKAGVEARALKAEGLL